MTVNVPAMSAMGRFRFESCNSALMLVAMIHPSYANDVATTAVNRAFRGSTSETTVVKFWTIIPLFRPKMVPMTAMSKSGISFMTVAVT